MIFNSYILKIKTVVIGFDGKGCALIQFFFSHSFTAADLIFLSTTLQVHIPAWPLPFCHFKALPPSLSMAS